jgi:hypothetical protein
MAKISQPTFSAGEVSPSVYGRVDLARYYTGLRTCRNFIVRQYGGVANRPGTEFVCEVKDSADTTRLFPFVFSTDQSYVVEMGDAYLRFIQDGAQLELGLGDVSTWSNVTAYTAGQYVKYSSVIYRAKQASTNKQPDVEPTYWLAQSIYELNGTYAHTEVDDAKYVQSADVMTFVHPDYQPKELRRSGTFSWTWSSFANENGPFLDINTTTTTIYASAETGSVTLTASAAVFTSSMVGGLIRLDEQDLSIIPPWEPSKKLVASGVSPFGMLRRSDGKTYKCLSTALGSVQTTGTVRPTHDTGSEFDGDGTLISGTGYVGVEWEYQHSGFGIVQITGFTSSTQVTGTVLVRLPNTVVGGTAAGGTWSHTGDGADTTWSVTGATSGASVDYTVTVAGTVLAPSQYSVNPTTDILTFVTAPGLGDAIVITELARNYLTDQWYMGAWSNEYGYPSCVTYYQDRLCFASNAEKPQTVWTSKSSDYVNFGTSVPTEDDDAITFTVNARQVNAIRDMVPLDSMILLTSDAEWRVTEGQDQVLTPDSVGVRVQSFYGAADLQAVVYGRSALFVQDRGSQVRDLTYSIQVDGYEGTDRTLLADHLFRGYSIVDHAFARIPYSALFAIRDDGTLLTFTYLPDQEVAGWARHDTDGYFERLCVVPEGDQDTVYFVVRRTINGSTKRYIERLAPRLFDDQRDAFFVDSGLTFDGRNTGATTMTVTGGSTWAAGETVTVTASASAFISGDVGDWVVLDPDDGAYRVLVTAYTSGTVVTGELMDPLPAAWRSTATTSWGFARDTFSGLSHLEGKTVSALVDGAAYPSVGAVSSGAITLDAHGVLVHIGLPITADLELLDIAVPNGETVRDRQKQVNKVSLLVQETRGLYAGPDSATLQEFPSRSPDDGYDTAALRTDIVEVSIEGAYRKSSRVFIRQTDPLPVTICGMIAHADFGG